MSAVLDPARRAATAPAPPGPSATRHELRFAREVIAGLSQPRKTLPGSSNGRSPGSDLEALILERCAGAIAAEARRGAVLVAVGKADLRTLLHALDAPAAMASVDGLASDRALPTDLPAGRRLVYWPGAALTGVAPGAASAAMRRVRAWAGDDALLVVGVETWADEAAALRAQAHETMVRADMELIQRIDRELGGDVDADAFDHEARVDLSRLCLETHLVSRREQRLQVLGRTFAMTRGESIHVRTAWGYTLSRFEALAEDAGWALSQRWTDAHGRHALHVLERAG